MLRRHLGEIFHELAGHKGSKIVEGHLMADHVHMCSSIPQKYAVANVVGVVIHFPATGSGWRAKPARLSRIADCK